MENRQAYNDFFLQELEKLNEVQQNAAGHFDGPMLVIAGPGTGKTQLLAARIGRILLETDTFPENILCLTFTDAGVVAMRERLQQFIGPAAHRVHILTFHAFCSSIIRDQAEYFGSYELEPLSALERIDLIRKIIDGLPPGHILFKGGQNPYFYEKGLQSLFQRMNAEDWTPEFLKQAAQQWIDELPQRPEFRYRVNRGNYRKGDLMPHKVEEAHKRMAQLCAAADLYPVYEQLKASSRRYDYEDMILWVLRAFDRHPFLLRNYQERYLYFLVDEYQDTNGAQNEILLKLIHFWESPNVFIVGDDDQSIYEFQGARLKNLLDFYHHYQNNLHILTLVDNYRSTQSILDWAATLIQKNQIRLLHFLPDLPAQKHLIAALPQRQASNNSPRIRQYSNRLQEIVHIVQRIEQLLAEGCPASEIAVIYAQHKQAERLGQLLARKNISFSAKRSIDLLQEPIIEKIIQILDFVHRESKVPHSGEALLFRMLHFRFWEIPSTDLAKIGFALSQRQEPDTMPWRTAIHSQELLNLLSLSTTENILKASAILETLLEAEANIPLPALVEQLINQTGILNAALKDQREQAMQIGVLFNFLDFVQEECQRHGRLGIGDFLELLERMRDNQISLPFHQQAPTGEGIQLVTAHSAKGLEFNNVFILDCVKEYWEPRNRNTPGSFYLPDTLSWSAEEDALEARRRLFYVAMTRAKEGLFLSFARHNDKGKELQRAIFIDELLEKFPDSIEYLNIPPQEILDVQRLFVEQSPPTILIPHEKNLAEAALRNFRMSISALNSFLNCPLEFYFNYIVHAPQVPGAPAIYGQAMHFAMKRLFLAMRSSSQKVFPPANELARYFAEALLRSQGLLKPIVFQNFTGQGKRALELLHQHYSGHWHKEVSVEYTIRQVEMEGIPLTGTIDKIEYHPNLSIGVIDYKTGRPDNDRIKAPSPSNPQGGTYWRQLAFYKLLFEALDRSSRTVTFGEIVYLEPGPQGDFDIHRIDFEPGDVQILRELIQDVYTRINAHDFYQGCGKKECPWCALAQQEILPASLSDPAIEELDD